MEKIKAWRGDNMDSSKEMIVCENLIKVYKTVDSEVVALQGLDLTVKEGELMAIIGNSGSGKSTLLNMIGGLDYPTAGKLLVDGKDLFKMNKKQMVRYKRETVGFVWQNNARNLIPYLTAVENVEITMNLTGSFRQRKRALELLDMVNMKHRSNNKLNQLSGGEQQRIAIAIALANNPKVLLADEPTGSVDTKTSDEILDLFKELNKKLGITVVIVTHDRLLEKKVNRVVAIRDGKTSSEFLRKSSYMEALSSINSQFEDELEEKVELAVIDKVGRVQIPQEFINKIGLNGKNKVKIELEDKKIIIYNPQDEEDVKGA